MTQQIDRKTLLQILQAQDITTLSHADLLRLFREEEGIADFQPDGVYEIDPRNGDRIIFNSSRAQRPHDNWPQSERPPQRLQKCVVCQGRTTGVIDVAELSAGFTFINKNLFPSLFPSEITSSGRTPYGFHFLQWTSSLHDKDWHNMPLEDRVTVMRRLAVLEHKLLFESAAYLPPADPSLVHDIFQAFILIIKNFGHLVGGSLTHGHQQIGLSNIMPQRMHDNWRFEQKRNEKFSAFLLRENWSRLLVRDYGPAVLLVPYFMRRPYDMILLVKNVSRQYLHELSPEEIVAVAEGWHDAIRALRLIMPDMGKEIAYNVITHNGPGAGLYFEFLPYTQEMGGFEHLGLFVCQGNPQDAADRIRYDLVDQSGVGALPEKAGGETNRSPAKTKGARE
jgi:galactose-1-phosphate uridylyltransferase